MARIWLVEYPHNLILGFITVVYYPRTVVTLNVAAHGSHQNGAPVASCEFDKCALWGATSQESAVFARWFRVALSPFLDLVHSSSGLVVNMSPANIGIGSRKVQMVQILIHVTIHRIRFALCCNSLSVGNLKRFVLEPIDPAEA
jgi:hypothetical protein